MLVYSNANRGINKIALTFDDGPNPHWTTQVLDILDRCNVKGNFFVLGKWVEKYPYVLKEVFRRGHLIGNHTYSHLKEGIEDFEKAEDIIYRTLFAHTEFIRVPYLKIDVPVFYGPAVRNELKIIGSDILTGDWYKNSDEILDIIVRETKNGSIILLHDSSENESELIDRPAQMYKALPNIIEHLKRKFEIVKLDDLDFQ